MNINYGYNNECIADDEKQFLSSNRLKMIADQYLQSQNSRENLYELTSSKMHSIRSSKTEIDLVINTKPRLSFSIESIIGVK